MADVVEIRIPVEQLQMGMYINRLDRDWVGTPFPFQGFHLTSKEQHATLRKLCLYVFVDVERQLPPEALKRGIGDYVAPIRGNARYVNRASLTDEAPNARRANDDARAFAERMITDARAGRKLSAQQVQDAVEPIVQSVLRNADAFLWISSLLSRDSYLYSHAVNCSALCAAMGRHMGFTEDALVHLATGGMLLDIGKAGVPEDLLNSAESLSPDDLPRVRAHVQVSLKIMDEAGIHNPVVRDMVLTHHERIDGSGYPDGLTLTNIPLFGRIAAVIDSYDAMTSERPYRPAVSRHEALQQLYRAHETLYQSEVVEQFLQCLGVYPTGSLVELSNGKVGIVMEQNQARRLQPRLLLLLDANKERYARFPEIDLLQHAQAHPDQPIRIVSALEPNAYGLDPRALYLV